MSASITVESIRAARAAKRVSRRAFSITSLVISCTTPGPSRRQSFRTVDSSGTRWSIAIRQKRRR